MANGFLYLVYSEDGQPNTHFTDTLVKSFNSLRETIPDSQTCLYTNILTESNHWIHDDLGFNHVIHDENISKYHIAKANGIKNSPFDKTIYLDVDMIFHLGDKLNDIFDILDTWELAVLHGNYLFSQEAMPDVHTGLLGVRKCDSTDMIMDAWIENFNAILPDNESESDQKAFRDIFYQNYSKFYILPQRFMFRWHMLYTVYDHAVMTHGYEMDKQEILKKLIDSLSNRLEE